eukprot:gene7270-9909_t
MDSSLGDTIPTSPIRSINVELLTDNSASFIKCIPNSKTATPFETPVFKGVAMILIRTDPIEKHLECFFVGKRRQFEVQVQGKFKREPYGELYVGAEATNKMELGIVTRAISKSAMKLCETMASGLHYSFGDSPTAANYQLPHAVAPLFSTFDKIVITPPNETPPPIGVPFEEDPEGRKIRSKFKSIFDVNLDMNCTYSFSVNTSNLNLLTWNLVGIPLIKPMDLRTFFGDSSIQLVGYEIPREVAQKHPSIHPKNLMNYIFNMKLTPIWDFDENLAANGLSDEGEDDLADESMEVKMSSTPAITGPEFVRLSSRMSDTIPEFLPEDASGSDGGDIVDYEQIDVDDNDDVDMESPPVTMKKDETVANKLNLKKSVNNVGNWFRRQIIPNTIPSQDGGEVPESMEYASIDFDMEYNGDLRYCPACIDVHDSRREKKRRILYIIPTVDYAMGLTTTTTNAIKSETDSVGSISTITAGMIHTPSLSIHRLKSHSEISKILSLSSIPKMHKNLKLSSNEKRRRQIVESYRSACKLNVHSVISKLNTFLNNPSDADYYFLNNSITNKYNNKSNNNSNNNSNNYEVWEGSVALATSRRHWTEHFLILNREAVLFHKNLDVKRVAFRIAISSIIAIRPLRPEEYPFEGFSYFQIETVSRIYYFMMKSDIQLNDCLKAFMSIRGQSIGNSPFEYNMTCFPDYSHLQHNMIPMQTTNTNGTNAISSVMIVNNSDNIYLANNPIHQSTSFSNLSNLNNNNNNNSNNNNSYNNSNNNNNNNYNNNNNNMQLDSYQTQNIDLSHFVNELESTYVAKSACWRLDKKRLLNYRKIIFMYPEKYMPIHPCELVESILKTAFHLCESDDIYLWIRFLDEISYLQTLKLTLLSEKERLVFFLNLYHVMIIHGSLVFGTPLAWNTWNGFFNNITYLIGYEVVSIAEIEYNILRAKMSRPSSFMRIAVPQSQFPGLALTHRDFRLSFCINNGSKSMSTVVPIYKVETIDQQLDEMTSLMLQETVEIDIQRKVLTLPKISLHDFATRKSSIATPLECVRSIMHYLRHDERLLLLKGWLSDGTVNHHIHVRFKNLSYRCRFFKLFNPNMNDSIILNSLPSFYSYAVHNNNDNNNNNNNGLLQAVTMPIAGGGGLVHNNNNNNNNNGGNIISSANSNVNATYMNMNSASDS